MAAVITGVDPRKASHTAVAISAALADQPVDVRLQHGRVDLVAVGGEGGD